ncbi:sensor histidine kinase [Proteiniborus sp. MB09-C3]|uniref:sensor histidine kinase n=1 Tax=Proteiniborus sp. MB09-C3 TaxID=3050072 RepID=UPI002556F528|nr:sensor histidine kinase [Proteiniborus sp. MB09-C3]WIV11587.1 GHKL domain-containing protein [Proteiniborus sp. MB09-C3]
MEIVANFLTNIIDVNILYYYMKAFVKGKKSNNKYVLLWLFIIVLLNTFVNSFFGLASFIGFILILISMSFVFFLIFKETFLNIFIMLLIGMVLMFALELAAANLIIYIFRLSPSLILELNIYRILAIAIAKGSFLLTVHYWIRKTSFFSYIRNKKSLPIAFIFLFNAIIIYMAFILYRYIRVSTYMDYIFFFLFTLCAILFSWLIYIFTKKMLEQEQQEELMKLKIKEYENQNFYIKNMEDIVQNIRAQRHDFNNHVSTLYGLIYLNKTEEAKKYILGLADDISFINKIIDVGHPVITALINMKRDKILREKINMNLDIQLPQNLSFNYIDLSIVIGNLLDNAIEACLNPSVNEPLINLRIFTKGYYLVIEVSNSKSNMVSTESESLGNRFTTKEDKENHGFGLSNIKRIVNQYEGLLKIEDKENIFAVHIALPLERDIE